MTTYTVKTIEDQAHECVGHVLEITFPPGRLAMDCPDHPGQYIELRTDGSNIRGSIKGQGLEFNATQLPDGGVHCLIRTTHGGSNEVGSWTAEEGGTGGGGDGGG